jgi:hypothetical protein
MRGGRFPFRESAISIGNIKQYAREYAIADRTGSKDQDVQESKEDQSKIRRLKQFIRTWCALESTLLCIKRVAAKAKQNDFLINKYVASFEKTVELVCYSLYKDPLIGIGQSSMSNVHSSLRIQRPMDLAVVKRFKALNTAVQIGTAR